MVRQRKASEQDAALAKCPTGIRGLDEITGGGLPRGRPTLVCGGTGCGKTLLAVEFLVRGIREFGEPGAFMAFEETAEELAKNVASLGFDLEGLIRRKQLAVDYVHVERSEIEETGEYDLEGLFVRLNAMIKGVGAKRVAIDSLEALFGGLLKEEILRAELRRLFRWLKNTGVTAVISAEQGANTFTRHGLEEYVSDCVIALDHRVADQIATRRLRVVKYRGSAHGTNEYPLMIDEHGLSVLPVSSLSLFHAVSRQRVSTGIARLDTMLDGKGYYRGSSVLVSGTAGTGKTSLAAAFADGSGRRGERCLYVAFEESPAQIMRNMSSIGFDLGTWVRKGLLRFHAVRPTAYGLEQHLVAIHKLVEDFQPAAVVVDPISNLPSVGMGNEPSFMLLRVIDFLKSRDITSLFTSLTSGATETEQTELGISSMMDTWLLLRTVETSWERNRLLYVLKSRGMWHSNQVREFVLTRTGIQIKDVYVGPGAVLTGSARVAQEVQDQAAAVTQRQTNARRQRELEHERRRVMAEMQALRSKSTTLTEELKILARDEGSRVDMAARSRTGMARARRAD
jgi:circadian clock protein KaiC